MTNINCPSFTLVPDETSTSYTLPAIGERTSFSWLGSFFAKKSSLSHELKLYQTLTTEKISNEWKATRLLEAVISARRKLNEESLEKQKYNLIKKIRENYNLEEFFQHKVSNYKILASAYKLFEYAEADNPVEIVDSKSHIF
jgi:hypothetical protein